MSIRDLVIVDRTVRVPKNWKNTRGVVHAMVATAMCQDDEELEDVLGMADSWRTLCESNVWEEKCPKLTTAQVNCLECIAHEELFQPSDT